MVDFEARKIWIKISLKETLLLLAESDHKKNFLLIKDRSFVEVIYGMMKILHLGKYNLTSYNEKELPFSESNSLHPYVNYKPNNHYYLYESFCNCPT